MNKILSTTLIVIAVLVLAGAIFFAGSMYTRANAFGPSMMNSWNNNNAYGPNNMMNGSGSNMMGGNGYNNANLTPLTVDKAKSAAEKYLANLNNSDMQIAEVMIFDNNAYVVVKETSTGKGAFELLVDPASQIAYPEYGPNMMWNLKYGCLNMEQMMGGNNSMMGNGMTLAPGASAGVGNCDGNNATPPNVSAEMTVNTEQAIQSAQKYLDANIP